MSSGVVDKVDPTWQIWDGDYKGTGRRRFKDPSTPNPMLMYWVEQPDGRFMVHADNSLTPLSAEELEEAYKANEPITINILRASGEVLAELTATRADYVSSLLQKLAEKQSSKITLLLGEGPISASARLGELAFTDPPTLSVVEEAWQVRSGKYSARNSTAFSVAMHTLIMWEDGTCFGEFEGGDEFENWSRFKAGGEWALDGNIVFTWRAPHSRSDLIHSPDPPKETPLTDDKIKEYSTAGFTYDGALLWHATKLEWQAEAPASNLL